LIADAPGTCQKKGQKPTCLTSDDCEGNTVSYCLFSSTRPSDSGTCVPYEQEGSSCGGNMDSKYQKQCLPSLECSASGDNTGTCQKKGQKPTCLTSDDCDSDTSYCLFSSNGPSYSGSCVPYQQEGDSCGGNMGSKFQKQCHPSLECGYSGTCQKKAGQKPTCLTSDDCDEDTSYCLFSSNGPSDSGSCVPYEQEGGSCGGFTMPGYQRECHPSLTCVYNPTLPDAPGTCQKNSGQNPTCLTSDDCDSDTSYCLFSSSGSSDSGSCVPYEQEGDSCGGYTMPGYQRQCHPSLTCVANSMIADAPGTCQKKTSNQGNCNSCDDCSQCLSNSECAWAIDRNSNQGQCLDRSTQTCPPQYDWYLDQCPCSGNVVIPQNVITCNVGIYDSYNLGYLRVLNNSCGECQAYRPPCCCLTSNDCDGDTSYCLFSSNGPSDSGFCVPFQQAGDSCGGNMGSQYQKQCHPSCECGSSGNCQAL